MALLAALTYRWAPRRVRCRRWPGRTGACRCDRRPDEHRRGRPSASLRTPPAAGTARPGTGPAADLKLRSTYHHLCSWAWSVPSVWSSASSSAMSPADRAKSKICAFSAMRSRWADLGMTRDRAAGTSAAAPGPRPPGCCATRTRRIGQVPAGVQVGCRPRPRRSAAGTRPAAPPVMQRAELDLVHGRAR